MHSEKISQQSCIQDSRSSGREQLAYPAGPGQYRSRRGSFQLSSARFPPRSLIALQDRVLACPSGADIEAGGLVREYQQFIGGEWVSSDNLFDDLDP